MSEYDNEPVPGLPELLPQGETILWQGAPDWRNIAQGTMHVKPIAAYFGLLLAWFVGSKLAIHQPAGTVFSTAGELALAAGLALGLLALFSWAVGRTTLYTVTNRRVVIRCGIALPMMLNIPFKHVVSADFKAARDGSGDISLCLAREEGIPYMMLWPHARPWRINRAQPMLRGIPDAKAAAQILARALAAAASVPPLPIADTVWDRKAPAAVPAGSALV